MPLISKFKRILLNRKSIILTLVLLVFYFVFLRGGADFSKIKTIEVKRGAVRSEVSSSGQITSSSEANLRFAVGGKIVSIPVSEGQNVTSGQVIAVLDRERYEIALRQAQQDVIAADAELAKVYDGVKKDDFETFEERITRTAAEAKKNKTFDAVKAAERDLRDTVLVAPISGKLISLNVNRLEDVLVTTEVGKIVNTEQGVEFTAEVDETEISKVFVGQKANIILDAFEEDEIDSDVVSISDVSLTTSTGATAYEVIMAIPKIEAYRVGMNGEARIVTAESNNTLYLPFDALVEDKYVWIVRDGTYEKVEVERGLESDLDFEVLNGVKQDDQIVISGFEEIGKKNLLNKVLKRP